MAIDALRGLLGKFFDTAFGYGVGGALQAAIDPAVQPLANEAWRLNPERPLLPDELANAVVQGVDDEAAAAGEALLSGINTERFGRMVRTAGAPIAPEQAFDLWNRGEISEGEVDTALRQSRLKPEWVERAKLLRHAILQAADLAEMVVQGVLEEAEAAAGAAKLGLAGDDFHRLVRLAGNPPGPETALSMWNRGIIGEPEVDRMLVQSRLKPEWVDVFKQSRLHPASAAQAVTAVVRERIPYAEGERIAAQNGVTAEAFKLEVDAMGRAMGIDQARTLVNRGLMSVEQFREVVARSDVKTSYTEFELALRVHYPSLYQLKQILSAGGIDDATALDILQKEGYPDNLAQGVITAAHSTKLAKHKDLTLAAILNSYADKALAREEAEQLIEKLGYDANDAGLLLGYADYQAGKRYRDAVVAVVKARLLQGDIDENQAGSLLDGIGVAPGERDQLIALWVFDREANPRLLTIADLNNAVKQGIFTPQQYRDYLPRLGYREPEVSVLVALHASG